jgi:nucleotide-binding universal stress UspA family protein
MTSTQEKVVLIALDGSPQAMRAVPLARTVASQLHAIATALHVAPSALAIDEARAALGLDSPELRDMPLRIRIGRPADQILSEVEQPEVDLLAMTTLGAGDSERELGSVAREVAINTSRPVLGLRPEVGTEPSTIAPPLKRLLVPLDGTRTTASALRPVTPLATRLGATVDVVHIAAPGARTPEERGSMVGPRYIDQPHHEWPTWTQELKERLCMACAGFSRDADIGVHLRGGEPGSEIVRFAQEAHHDAIVLVRRSKLEPDRARTLRTVVRDSLCPFLMVGGPE